MQLNKANFDLIAAVVPKLNLKFFVCCFKQPACSNMFPPFSYYSYYKRVLRLLEKKKKKSRRHGKALCTNATFIVVQTILRHLFHIIMQQ